MKITTDMIDEVMELTGEDYFTIKTALEKNDGDVIKTVAELKGDTYSEEINYDGKNVSITPKDVLATIKRIWEEGNAHRLIVEKNGEEVVNLSLAVSGIALVALTLPVLAILGTAIITDYNIKLLLKDGNEININEETLKDKFNDLTGKNNN